MIFFCKSALERVKIFGWPPHVIHCHGWMTSLVPLYLKTAYKKEPVFSYSKTIFTAQSDLFPETLNNGFIKKAIISNEIREKDLDLFKEGTNGSLTLGGSKCADVVVFGDEDANKQYADEIKPSRYKKVIRFDESWNDDVTPLLDLYKSLTES